MCLSLELLTGDLLLVFDSSPNNHFFETGLEFCFRRTHQNKIIPRHFLGEEVNAQKARVGSWTYLVVTHFLWFNDAKLSSTQETMTPGAAQAAFGAALS